MAVTRRTRVLSVLAAGSLAFVSAAPAAVAQPESPPAEETGLATPPPLPPDYATPKDKGEPDHPYTVKTQCVQSKGSTAPLEYKPWGQDLLRFDEIAKFATGKRQKVAVIDTGVSRHDYFQNRLEGG